MSSEVRGQVEARPRLPWGAKSGDGETTDVEAIRRVTVVVLTLLNPVAATLTWAAVLIVNRVPAIRRQPAGRLFAGSLVLALGVLALKTARLYVSPFADAWQALSGAPSGSRRAVLADTAGAEWPWWIVRQLPVAATAAICISLFVLWRRQKYRAAFRDVEHDADPEDVAAAVAAIDRQSAEPASRTAELMLRLGVDRQTAGVYELAGAAAELHMVVIGPTGYGKTTTLDRLTWELVGSPAAAALRNPHVMIDMKGDPGVVEYRRRLAAAGGRQCHVVTVDGRGATTTYNPLRHGTPAELRNKLVQAEETSQDGGFSEPYYRSVGSRWLLLVCTVLVDLVDNRRLTLTGGQRRPWRRDLADLVRLMQPDVLRRQTAEASPAVAERINDYFTTADDNLMREVSGIYQRYADVAEGAAGPVIVDRPDGLDLYAAIMAGDLVVFSLDAAADATAARQLGNLALMDLTLIGGRMQEERFTASGRRCALIVDEFSALGGSALLNFYARARSAGLITTLATQSTADFKAVSDQFDAAVRTSGNVVVLHRQKNDDADQWARSIGTVQGFQETLQVTEDADALGTLTAASGVGSLRVVDKFIIHPNQFKTLGQGEAVVLVGHPETSQRRVQIAAAPPLPAVPPLVRPPRGETPVAATWPPVPASSENADQPALPLAAPHHEEAEASGNDSAAAEPGTTRVSDTPTPVAADDDDDPGDNWHERARE